jgi:choline kinase
MISIVSLIYKSTVFADAVYDSIMEFTPFIHTGKAEFFFIANDATPRVLEHISRKNYKFFVNNNPIRTEQELFDMGIGWPEYIHRVYRGWNSAIMNAKGEIVVLVNSDNLFSPNWLENLLKNLTQKTIVCSQLIERKHPKYVLFPGAHHGEFGTHPKNFNKEAFLNLHRNILEGFDSVKETIKN